MQTLLLNTRQIDRSNSTWRLPCLDGRATKSSERSALLRVCNYCQFLPKDMLKGPTTLIRLLISASYRETVAFGIHKKTEQQRSSSREALSKPDTGRHHKSQLTSHFQQQQSPGKDALTTQCAAGGFAYLSFQIVTSTQADTTNQVIEPDRLGGCEHTVWDRGNGWGMKRKFLDGLCVRKTVGTPFEK